MTRKSPFVRGYVECLLWASSDDSDEPLDRNYSESDLSAEAWERILADCATFTSRAGDLISEDNRNRESQYDAEELAGHDFWLTRNGHGAGFWDGDWQFEVGEQLTELSKEFGEQDPTVGDDGQIYLYGGKAVVA